MNVLVVCHGNINRSPLCAAVLSRNHGLFVKSAGFVNPGRRAAKKMREAASSFGLDLEGHRSQLVTLELVRQAHCIVYMDGGNLRRLKQLGVEDVKLRCLGRYSSPQLTRIADPNFMLKGSTEFLNVVALIVRASEALGRQLC